MPDNQTIQQLRGAIEDLISVGADMEKITSAEHRISMDLTIDFVNSLLPFDATVNNSNQVVDVRLVNRWVAMVVVKEDNTVVSGQYIDQTYASNTITISPDQNLRGRMVTITFAQQEI